MKIALFQVFILNHPRRICLFVACLLFLTFSFVARQEAIAQSNQFTLEKEQHWETYHVGGTCITSNKLSVADVDGDGVMEIITGAGMYYLVNGTRTVSEPTLKIYNWNGQNITLEKSHKWAGSIGSIYACDSNGDGAIEIIITGSIRNSTGSYPQLMIWQWNGEAMVLKGSYGVTSISSVSVGDMDKDGKPEIISVGRFSNSSQFFAALRMWRWDGISLTLKKSVEWGAANSTTANSVYVYDVDGDGVDEVITGGYTNTLKNSSGQIRIWYWNGQDFSLKANEEWRPKDGYGLTIAGGVEGNTVVNNVKAGDVDGDGIIEIITGGFTYDGEKTNAQLRIWNWNGQTLTLRKAKSGQLKTS